MSRHAYRPETAALLDSMQTILRRQVNTPETMEARRKDFQLELLISDAVSIVILATLALALLVYLTNRN